MKDKKNFLYASACVAALLCGGGLSPAQADCGTGGQCSVTDGTTKNLTGGIYEAIHDSSPEGFALFAMGSGSTITGSGLTLALKSSGDEYAIVQAIDGGSISLTNSKIDGVSTSQQIFFKPKAGFLVIGTQAPAQITFDGGSISVREQVAHVGANGQLSLLNGVLVEATTGKTNGSDTVFHVEENGQLTIKGGSIRTGVTSISGNTQILGRFASVVHAEGSADISLEGVDITAHLAPAGDIHNALWLEGSAKASVTGGSISGSGLDFVAVESGLNAQARLKGTNITVDDSKAVALEAYGNTFLGDDVTQPRTAILFEDGKIITQGIANVAIDAYEGGRVVVNNSEIIVKDVALLAHDNAEVTLTNSSIQANGVTSDPQVALAHNAVVNFNDVKMTAYGIGVLFAPLVGNNGNASFNMVDGFISSGAIAVANNSGADNIFRVTNGSISGMDLVGVQVREDNPSLGSKLNFIADNAILSGGAAMDEYSHLAMDLRNGTRWNVRPAEVYNMTGNYGSSHVSLLTLGSGSSLEFGGQNYQTLHVGYGVLGTTTVYNGRMANDVGDTPSITFNTLLNEGGAFNNQSTDRLLINGDVSGTTLVNIAVQPGSTGGVTGNTASDGISLIQVSGQAAADSFYLAAPVTLSGTSFIYNLYGFAPGTTDEEQRLVAGQGNNFWDFRLQNVVMPDPDPTPPPAPPVTPPPAPPVTPPPAPPVTPPPAPPVTPPPTASTPQVAPQVSNYITAPTALFQASLMNVDGLHQRLGEIRKNAVVDGDSGRGNFFVRGFFGNYDYASNRSVTQYGYDADIRYAAMQLGGNIYGFENEQSLWLFGLSASRGELGFSPQQVAGSAKTDMDLWNVAGYATYLHQSGFYVDTLLSYGGFRGTISSQPYGNGAKLKGDSFSASIETGMSFALSDTGWSIDPQAQLVYQRLSFDRAVDSSAALPGQTGFAVALGHPDQWIGRVGATVKKDTFIKEGVPATLYGKMNLIHGFGGDDKVWAGNEFILGDFGTHLESGLGMSVEFSKNSTLFSDVSWKERVSNAGISGFAFNGGLRVNF